MPSRPASSRRRGSARGRQPVRTENVPKTKHNQTEAAAASPLGARRGCRSPLAYEEDTNGDGGHRQCCETDGGERAPHHQDRARGQLASHCHGQDSQGVPTHITGIDLDQDVGQWRSDERKRNDQRQRHDGCPTEHASRIFLDVARYRSDQSWDCREPKARGEGDAEGCTRRRRQRSVGLQVAAEAVRDQQREQRAREHRRALTGRNQRHLPSRRRTPGDRGHADHPPRQPSAALTRNRSRSPPQPY